MPKDKKQQKERDPLLFSVMLPFLHMKKKINLREEIKVNAEDLSKEFAEQSGKYAYWASLEANAEGLVNKLEDERNAMFAVLGEETRATLKEEQPKPPTEAQIKNTVNQDESYQQATSTLRKAELQWKLLKVAKKSFEQRANMLISLGATQRKEHASDIEALADKASKIVSHLTDDSDEDDE